MKNLLFTSTLIFLTFTSCDNSRTQDNQEKNTPKALEDKSSSYEILSKRSSDDLVESLYKELAEKTPELEELESKIENLATSHSDSTELFDKYHGKNQAYYSAANSHIEQIKDSVLKIKMKDLIAGSFTKYNASISRHSNLLKSIEIKNLTLADLHTVLKVTRTLPLIEKYQQDNLPSTKPLEGFSRKLDQTIIFADTLTKK